MYVHIHSPPVAPRGGLASASPPSAPVAGSIPLPPPAQRAWKGTNRRAGDGESRGRLARAADPRRALAPPVPCPMGKPTVGRERRVWRGPSRGGEGGGGSVHAPCWTRRLCKRGRLVTCRGRPPAEGTVTPGTTARLPVLPPGVRRWIYRQDSGSGSSVDQQPHNTRANACTPPPPACPPTLLANADPSLLPPSFRPPPSLFPHRPLVRTRPVPCQAPAPPRRWRPTRRPPAVAWLPPPSLWRS